MKVYNTINEFTNIEVLTDQNRFILGENMIISSKSQRYFNRENFLEFDDQEDNYDRKFLLKPENQLVDDKISKDCEFDPDNDIFSDWSPNRFPKCYLVHVDRKNLGILTHSVRVLAPYVEAYMNLFKFIRHLEPMRAYKGNINYLKDI